MFRSVPIRWKWNFSFRGASNCSRSDQHPCCLWRPLATHTGCYLRAASFWRPISFQFYDPQRPSWESFLGLLVPTYYSVKTAPKTNDLIHFLLFENLVEFDRCQRKFQENLIKLSSRFGSNLNDRDALELSFIWKNKPLPLCIKWSRLHGNLRKKMFRVAKTLPVKCTCGKNVQIAALWFFQRLN